MKWEDKTEMAKLLNNGKYKEATDYYINHEDWEHWDDIQALDIFITSFDLTRADEIIAFEDKLKYLRTNHEEHYRRLRFRAFVRLEVLQDEFEQIHKGTSNFKK